jgi:hypothetical protein
MRQINDHMKQVMGIQKQPKPSFNPKNWNWTTIITWTVIIFFGYKIAKFIYTLIF